MFEEEFRTYGIDDPEVRALQAAMPRELFMLCEDLLGRWQQAGMPIKPAGRGFALQAPHSDRLTTVGWLYPPDRRHAQPRIEVALGLLQRREIPPDHLEALRDDLTRFPTYVPDDESAVLELPVTDRLTREDMRRLAGALVQFGLSLA